MNLLDLPVRSRRGGFYWATIVAFLIVHGGFLAYVLSHSTSSGRLRHPRLADANLELFASPPAPALPRGDREALPWERMEVKPSAAPAPQAQAHRETATPDEDTVASQMNDALPEDNAVAVKSLPLPERMSKYRRRALAATALRDGQYGVPMSLPARRMSRISGEQRLAEHTAESAAPMPAELPPLRLLAMPAQDASGPMSGESRASELDMSAQGQPVAAVLPKEAGVAMLAAQIANDARMLPEDRASPQPPAPPASTKNASAPGANPRIAPPAQTKKPGTAEKSIPRKSEVALRPKAALKKAEAYRAQVRSHLAAHRPAGGAGSGSAVVAFDLSQKGRLLSARIARSSGNPAMDESVMQSVHRSEPFPKPPEGMDAKQLRFVIPFEFQ
jgi:protein TonB